MSLFNTIYHTGIVIYICMYSNHLCRTVIDYWNNVPPSEYSTGSMKYVHTDTYTLPFCTYVYR